MRALHHTLAQLAGLHRPYRMSQTRRSRLRPAGDRINELGPAAPPDPAAKTALLFALSGQKEGEKKNVVRFGVSWGQCLGSSCIPTARGTGGGRLPNHRQKAPTTAGGGRKQRNVQDKMDNQRRTNEIQKNKTKNQNPANIFIYFSQTVRHFPPTARSLVAMVTPSVCYISSFTRSEIQRRTPRACKRRRIGRALHIRHTSEA